MEMLRPGEIKIEKKGKAVITLRLKNGKVIKRVHFLRLFPFTDLENYISVCVKTENEYSEVGILEKIKGLKPAEQKIVREDLHYRYFVPEIKEIRKIYSKHGLHEFNTKTDRGDKVFYLKNLRENFHMNDKGSIVLTDIEKCRFKISSYGKLPQKSREELDRIML